MPKVSTMASGTPLLYFVAKRDIDASEEVSYDYGDRRKEVVKAFPWLGQ